MWRFILCTPMTDGNYSQYFPFLALGYVQADLYARRDFGTLRSMGNLAEQVALRNTVVLRDENPLDLAACEENPS
jgi:hypothetical protein